MIKDTIQMTLIQIDNYGPWTVSLGPGREADLQVLQAELYADVQRLFSIKGGLVFYARFDNMLALTNGISVDEHREIQEKICRRYPFTISLGVGVGETAAEAQREATEVLQRHGSSQAKDRRKILATADRQLGKKGGIVQIAHIDVNDATSRLTDTVSAYDALLAMLSVYKILAEEFQKKKSLVFFNGGDNFLAISNGLTKQEYAEILSRVSKSTWLKLKAGVGRASSATEALRLASTALDEIRQVEGRRPVHIKSM